MESDFLRLVVFFSEQIQLAFIPRPAFYILPLCYSVLHRGNGGSILVRCMETCSRMFFCSRAVKTSEIVNGFLKQ